MQSTQILINKSTWLITCALIAGGINVLGYAPYNMWYLSVIALIALCYLFAIQNKSSKLTFSFVFAFYFASNFGSLFWLEHVLSGYGQMPIALVIVVLVLFASYLALFPATLAAIVNRCFKKQPFRKLVIAFPVISVIAEELSGALFTGFPWSSLAYTQVDSLFSNLAPLIGSAGITYVLLLTCAFIALFIKKHNVLYIMSPVCILFFLLWLNSVVYTDELTPVKVALMQGNIPTETKWNPELITPTFKTYFKLLDENKDAQLIIWPESAIPVLENNAVGILKDLDTELFNSKTALITGVQYYDAPHEKFYNGVIGIGLIDKEGVNHYIPGISNRYYKRHLVPIGEFVPFESVLRLLGPIFNMPMSSFSRGNNIQPNIEAMGLNVATAICYEIIFSREMRDQITSKTNLIVTVSNDGWFNYTNGPYQHLNIARMRAKEFRKPILRATNNGITAVIDQHGNLVKKLPQNREATLRTDFVPTKGITPYAQFGLWPMWIFFTLLLCFSAINRLSKLIYIILYRLQTRLFRRVDRDVI